VVCVTDEAGRFRGSGFFVAPGQFWDLWAQDRHALIEAKNSDSRARPRMAIGQLYHYRRSHEPPVHLAVLLPHQPSPDGLALLQSTSIEAI